MTVDPVYKLILKLACTSKLRKKNLFSSRVFTYGHQWFTWSKINYFLTDWLKLAREIRAESSNTFQKPYTAGCTASHYYLPFQFTQAKHQCFSLWLLHYQYFLYRDSTVLINANTWLIFKFRKSPSPLQVLYFRQPHWLKHPYMADVLKNPWKHQAWWLSNLSQTLSGHF